jgi:DNA-binding NarL/FixJ family response regulator
VTRARVLIADDHTLLREGVRAFIELDPRFSVAGEACDTREVLRAAAELRPDVLLLDINMPGGSALAAISQLLVEQRDLRVVVLTMHDEPEFLRAALAAGAVGYVLKASTHSRLIAALEAAVAGRMYVDPSFPAGLPAAPEPNDVVLSARERQVLALLAAGLTYRDAAEQLHVGTRTVESHRRRIAEKLGLRTRADLLRYSLELGLITPSSRPAAGEPLP